MIGRVALVPAIAVLVAAPVLFSSMSALDRLGVILAFSVLVTLSLAHGVLSVWTMARLDSDRRASGARPPATIRAGLILGALFAIPIAFIAEPLWSDDVYRYLAEGRMSASGLWPLSYPLDSPKVTDLTGPFLEAANHRDVRGVYPPVAQAAFWLTSLWRGHELLVWRVICALAFAACAFALYTGALFVAEERAEAGIAPRTPANSGDARARADWIVALFVSHPLVLITAMESAHIDLLALAMVMSALALWQRGRNWSVGVLVGLAAGVKFYPLLALAALPWMGNPRRSGRVALASLAICALWVAAALVLGGRQAFGSLGGYVGNWTFNGPVYTAVHPILEAVATWLWGGGSFEFRPLTLWNELRGQVRYFDGVASGVGYVTAGSLAGGLYRVLWLLSVAAMSLWSVLRSGGVMSVPRRLSLLFGVFWLLSPVVHPWYLLWVLPGLMAPRAGAASWWALSWSWSVPLAYFARASAQAGLGWSLPWWVLVLEVACWGALVGLLAHRSRSARGV